MPDHLHIVLEALDKEADLVKFVTRFKQYAGFEYRRETGSRLWQEGFYDRVLRKEEAAEDAVRYVLSNPVRAGLVMAVHEWPFSGSDVCDIRYVTG